MSPCLSKLQLVKVGTFFETQRIIINKRRDNITESTKRDGYFTFKKAAEDRQDGDNSRIDVKNLLSSHKLMIVNYLYVFRIGIIVITDVLNACL